MAVRCSKCGEELLGAVNRCWKCGQTFALHPEMDGTPPVRTEPGSSTGQKGSGVFVGQGPSIQQSVIPTKTPDPLTVAASSAPVVPPTVTNWTPRPLPPRRATTAELIEARRAGQMAMGGTVASIVLGILAAGFSVLWPPAAIIAVLGLCMGIWGLYSPGRNWALIGMLICCLAIGIGMYGGARALYVYVESQRPATIEYQPDPSEPEQ
jgi:hypothetical protein